jgi:4-hydroxythreonine-4-phosphate dehydrogenase
MTGPRHNLQEIIGITMGCPVGIGPEIVLRFLAAWGNGGEYRPLVLGDIGVLRRIAGELGMAVAIREWRPGDDLEGEGIPVLPVSRLDAGELIWGRPTVETGRAMAFYIEQAVRLQQAGVLAAMVTCPIGKKYLREAGYPYPGHTEMLAALCNAGDYAMMMAGNRLRVTLVTIHQPLKEVPETISPEGVLRLISITGRSLREDFGINSPRLAVAGLNPHAGEDGLFGDEEQRIIIPAITAAREHGWQATGPMPPDTVFHMAAAGHFDAVICMYHDQGLIPFKLLHFKDGVNVTLGLPIVRTSVDHGTAYDIAGLGRADAGSLAAAFRLAALIVSNRRRLNS